MTAFFITTTIILLIPYMIAFGFYIKWKRRNKSVFPSKELLLTEDQEADSFEDRIKQQFDL